MKLELYQLKNESIWCTITADLSDGKLCISGQDLGRRVMELLGTDEYEYFLSLDEENTRKLFESLGCAEEPDAEKLQVIKDTFENSRADSALKDYCEERGIKTSFWSY